MRLIVPAGPARIVATPVQPLPLDARRWGERIVVGIAPPEAVSVRRVEETQLEEGWPLTLVWSDLGAERRLHALYRFAGHGCAGVALGDDADAAEPQLRAARIDFDDGTIAALRQVWEGLELGPPSMGAVEGGLPDLLRGWSRHIIAEGLVLIAPDGPASAAVQVFEQRRPLRPLREIVAETVAGMAAPLRAGARVGPVELFDTIEGEHGGAVTITSLLPSGERVLRTLAMLLADDAYALIDGVVAQPALEAPTAALVRAVARNYFLALGSDRRRPCYHDLPEGWYAARRAHATLLHDPTCAAVIQVFDARPTSLGVPDSCDRMLFVDSPDLADAEPPGEAQRVRSAHGLAGARRAFRGHAKTLHRVTMTDDRYVYVAQLEAPDDKIEGCLPDFLSVVTSLRPVPRPVKTEALTHWVE
jgi:hypothetical protein